MARNLYGATSADFTLTSGGRVVPGATLTIWSARTGGTQITDLLDKDSVATTTVTSDADGSIVYYGPNNDKTVHWADSGVGSRIAIRPVDITGDPPVLSIGTVGTGAAAASLTGTSEAPVLNLTLPTAGANGVNTAAIQDGAVTAAKLAVQPGNLLTANQASGTEDGTTTGFYVYSGSPTLSSSTANAYSGTRSLRVDNADSGIIGIAPTMRPAVTPGVPHTFTVKVKGTMTANLQMAVAWYDAGGSLLSQVLDLPSIAMTGSAWATFAVTLTPPANAAAANFYRYTLSAAGTLYFDEWGVWKGTGGQWAMPGEPIRGLTDAPIGNLLPLNVATGTDAEAATTGFAAENATLSSSTAQAAQGSRSLLVTSTVTGNFDAFVNIPVASLIVGETYTAVASFRAASGTRDYRLIATCTGVGTQFNSNTVTNPSGFTEARVTFTVPTGTTGINLYLANATSGSIGDAFYVDKIGLWRGAAGTWSLPGVPVTGQSHIASNGAVHLSGTGTPEGVVVAAPGSTWLQTDATTDVKGWLRWIKASGTGNTGWVVGPEADTGWRSIGGTLSPTNCTLTSVYLRRIGNAVYLNTRVTATASVATLTVGTLPTGFKPTHSTDVAGQSEGATSTAFQVRSAAVEFYRAGGHASTSIYVGVATYATTDAWPTSLPGSAA